MKHATDEENQESANVEKDDKDKEKAEKEETDENTDVDKEAGKDASEEKDHDSGETSEPIRVIYNNFHQYTFHRILVLFANVLISSISIFRIKQSIIYKRKNDHKALTTLRMR